jgi:hypothetical protein
LVGFDGMATDRGVLGLVVMEQGRKREKRRERGRMCLRSEVKAGPDESRQRHRSAIADTSNFG